MHYVFQNCPPLSGVGGSIESHLRALGETERWIIEVLMHLLLELRSHVYKNAVDTCPFKEVSAPSGNFFTLQLLELYAG